MDNLTEITLAWELHGQGVPKAHIAKHLGRNRETVILWLQGIEEQGLTAFLKHYQKANKQPRPARQVRTTTNQFCGLPCRAVLAALRRPSRPTGKRVRSRVPQRGSVLLPSAPPQ
jgi:hypothetical protein